MLEKHSKVQKIFHAFPRFHTLPFEQICLCLEVSRVAVCLFVKSQMCVTQCTAVAGVGTELSQTKLRRS